MSARLIPEWTRYTDHNNQFYFLHEDTGESRWMLPESEEEELFTSLSTELTSFPDSTFVSNLPC